MVNYFLVLIVVALVGGIGPALTTAVLSAVLLNFVFVPPIHSFSVADPQNLLPLIMMVVAAVMVAVVVDRAAAIPLSMVCATSGISVLPDALPRP